MDSVFSWLNTNQGALSAILTTVYVFATIIMAILMLRANSLSTKSIQQSKELEQERTRPYILFDIVADNLIIYAEIRNEGLTSAKNISFKITPDLTTEQRNGKPCAFSQEPLSYLAPGRNIRDFVAVGHAFFNVHENPVFVCKAVYENVNGKIFNEVFHLDLNYLKSLINITSPDIGKELEKIRKEFDKMSSEVRTFVKSPIKVIQGKEVNEP